MLRMQNFRCLTIFILIISIQAFSSDFLLTSEAEDLTDVLIQGFSFRAFGRDTSLAARAVAPAFSDAIAQAMTQDLPLASAPPAYAFGRRYIGPIPISLPQILHKIPGPLFSERAPTIGIGRFSLGVGYAFVDFSDLNGTDLDDIRSPGLLNEIFDSESMTLGNNLFFSPASASLIRTRIDLQAHIIAPTLRYGITDNWDISLSIPIVNTFLRVRNEAIRVADIDFPSVGAVFARDQQSNISEFLGFFGSTGDRLVQLPLPQVPYVQSRRSSGILSKASGSATGIGDITLRSKYEFWPRESGGMALGLNLQLPSGEEKDFHGTGEVHLGTFLYLSEVLWERFEPRLNIGIDFNADDVDRSSFLYSVGGTLLIGESLGLIVDLIGRSEFGRLPVRVPPEGRFDEGVSLDRDPDTCTTEQPCFIDVSKGFVSFPFFPERIKRNDIIDFSFGFRYALGKQGSIFFGIVVPVNDEGFRPDFIPSGGMEYTF